MAWVDSRSLHGRRAYIGRGAVAIKSRKLQIIAQKRPGPH
jgi:hypothetical protein